VRSFLTCRLSDFILISTVFYFFNIFICISCFFIVCEPRERLIRIIIRVRSVFCLPIDVCSTQPPVSSLTSEYFGTVRYGSTVTGPHSYITSESTWLSENAYLLLGLFHVRLMRLRSIKCVFDTFIIFPWVTLSNTAADYRNERAIMDP